LSGLGWTLRRLRAMSAGEIAHRAGIALRDRFAPARHELITALEAFDDAFGATADPPLPSAPPALTAEVFEPVRAAADALMAGRWPLFGEIVRLDDPPDWNRNYRTGESWPDLSTRRIDHRRTDVAGDVKFAWELGRLTALPTLACAARAEGDAARAERCARWLEDWNETNPFAHGIHYASGIEMAVRVLTLHWTLALSGARLAPGTRRATLGAMVQQALHCRDHLSLGSSANNHLISEYAAMTVMGAGYPSMHGAQRLLDRGLAGLEAETLRQIHADGVPAEQAFGYLPFIWELLLLGFVAAEAAGRTIAPAVRDRLAASLGFARALRLPAGRLPPVGDEDDARILLAEIDAPRVDLAGNALAAWLGAAPGLSSGHSALAWLVAGRAPAPPAAPREGAIEFPHGGYSAWRHGAQLVTFDHGPLGYGSLAAHGHADALAVTIHWNDVPLVADPGTFSYHGDRAARDRCRSTPVHATVHFGGSSQSEMLGPFLWGRRARIAAEGSGFACTWWTGESHVRRVDTRPGRIEIHDRVRGHDAQLVLPLAPGARVELDGRTARVAAGSDAAPVRMRVVAYGAGPWRLENSEHASGFGRVAPATRLAAPFTEREAKTLIEIDAG
jgi:hypothetical protein